MMAVIEYWMDNRRNPFDKDGYTNAWCLVKRVTPDMGNRTDQVIAVFDLDSEAETFMAHCLKSDPMVSIPGETEKYLRTRFCK